MKNLLTLLMLLVLSANFSFAQNTPAALRVDEVEEMIPLDRNAPSIPVFQKQEEPEHKLSLEKPPKKKKKPRRMDSGWEAFFGILGILITVGGLVAGMILFATIGWWAILIPLGGILLGLLIAAIPSTAGGRLAGLLSAFLWLLAAVPTGLVWFIWVIVLGIIELIN